MKNIFSLMISFLILGYGGAVCVHAQDSSADSPITANTSVNSEYTIGPENVLQIDVYYGKNERISQKVRVSSDGMINFPLVGDVKAVGFTVADFQDKLTKLLGDDYLVDPQVTVFIEEYSTVSILGEVKNPGAYPIKGKLTLLELISLAQGFTENASPDNINLIHTNIDGTKEERMVQADNDSNKENHSNVDLSPGDVVIVTDSKVSIMGEVNKPGVYPLKGKATILELISLAGGFTNIAAMNNIKIVHTLADGTKVERVVRAFDDMNKQSVDQSKLILSRGDMIIVPDSKVSIMGEVKNPGVYPLKGKLTVLELISLAEGFTNIAAVDDIKVIHINVDGTKVETIVRAYGDIHKKNSDKNDFVLSRGDVVIVPDSMFSITGEVKNPGIYPLKGRSTVLDLISLAGGLTNTADPDNIKVIHTRANGTKEEQLITGNNESEYANVFLSRGDAVIVGPDNMFSITGEVKNPGIYPLKGNSTVLDLISLAGGLTDTADPDNIKVMHTNPDGTKDEKLVRNYNENDNDSVILAPGDVVIVPDSMVSIMGEVNKPGIYPIKGRLTVLELVSLAEGFTKIASPNRIKVVHTNPDGTKDETVVRAYDYMNKPDGEKESVVLKSGDVVIVPESIF